MPETHPQSPLNIGWAQTNITPADPVLLWGQFHARVSEGVADPITATALALQSPEDHVVLVSCDIVAIPDALRDAIRTRLKDKTPGLDPTKVVLHATHTHTAPEIYSPSLYRAGPDFKRLTISDEVGIDLPAMNPSDYLLFAADRIADTIAQAWNARSPGALAYGAGAAVVGRNRRMVDTAGKSTMYGKTNTPTFSHIEGYEDHSIGFLATYDVHSKLTGLAVNVACPSQVSENDYTLSADYWHETRLELRRQFGDALFVLPQCSAAGDQSPHLLYDKPAAQRMLQLKGRTVRQEIAARLVAAARDTVPFLAAAIDPRPRLRHHVETLDLPMTTLSQEDVRTALAEADQCRLQYETEMKKLTADPTLRQKPRWYRDLTQAFRRMQWLQAVAQRFETAKTHPNLPAELHVITLGNLALVTLPFEYYLDFGIRIKARSSATQTLLIQLAGPGSYCPSPRSLVGGGYGSLPASNPCGPQAGQLLAEKALALIAQLIPQ